MSTDNRRPSEAIDRSVDIEAQFRELQSALTKLWCAWRCSGDAKTPDPCGDEHTSRGTSGAGPDDRQRDTGDGGERPALLRTAEATRVPTAVRTRCQGCGHFDNELTDDPECSAYGNRGHWMLDVDEHGMAIPPVRDTNEAPETPRIWRDIKRSWSLANGELLVLECGHSAHVGPYPTGRCEQSGIGLCRAWCDRCTAKNEIETLRSRVRSLEIERRRESDPYEVAALLVERQASIHRMRAQSFADDSDRADGEAQADDIDRATAAAEALEYTASRIRELARKGGGG